MTCLFENREENGGRFIRKDKSNSFPSKNFVKKRVPNALAAQERKVEEEYMFGDEDGDEVVGVAHVAIATSFSSPLSLFKSPNENAPSIPTCLMENATSVTTPSPKSIASTSPSLLDCVDKIEKEAHVTNDLDEWLAKLKGVTKVNVDALIE